MKLILFIATVLFCFNSCKKHYAEAQLVKNCTGTYFLIDGEYYKVCNRDDFVYIPNESVMKIKYKLVEDENCDSHASTMCILHFEYSGIIEVKVLENL